MLTFVFLSRSSSILTVDYRNRRIGEFLKELNLTEGRATGIPRIKKSLSDNGSPKAIFDLDDPDRRFFVVEILIHEAFRMQKSGGKTGGKTGGKSIAKIKGYIDLTPRQKELLELLIEDNSITYKKWQWP